MIEKIILNYLLRELSVPVCLEEPRAKENEYVLIRKIDGGIVNQIRNATFDVICISTSLQKSAELAEEVREKMLNAIALEEISSVNVGGEYSDIDTNTKRYAYALTFNFIYY